MLERFTAHGASCCAAPLCLNRQGPAQLTRRDGCDSSFDNRNGAMCSGPRVCGWTGCLPSGARANLPTVLSGFWGFSTYQLFPFSGRSPWITSPPTAPAAYSNNHCTREAAPPHRNGALSTALRLLPTSNAPRDWRRAPTAGSACCRANPRDESPGPPCCPFVQIRLALRFRYGESGIRLSRDGCTATALGAGRTATVHHLGADDLVSRFPVI